MKLISLNTLGGRMFEPLMNFIKTESESTDIFCLQEVLQTSTNITDTHGYRANLFNELELALPNFTSIFSVTQENCDYTGKIEEDIHHGNAIFVKKDLEVVTSADTFISGDEDSFKSGNFAHFPSKVQGVNLNINGKPLTIFNLHGVSKPGEKLDNENRINQSNKILNFAKQFEGEKIIVGDFNLLPETKSIRMFEENGYKNLIKDFSIKSTRGKILKQLHPEYEHTAQGWQEYADYAFATPNLKVSKFEVPDIAISDHLPLVTQFEL